MTVYLLSFTAIAQDISSNTKANFIANNSPAIIKAKKLLYQQLRGVKNKEMRALMFDAIDNPNFQVQHRIGVDENKKAQLLDQLKEAQLIPKGSPISDQQIIEGIFPPLRNHNNQPVIPMPYIAAAGGTKGHHHNYPGGLVVHTATTMAFAKAQGEIASRFYAHQPKFIDTELTSIALFWHDWAKLFMYQYLSDGKLLEEYYFGGNGVSDDYGAGGYSIEMGHHILSLAEIMSRKFPIDIVLTLAAVHYEMTRENEYKMVNTIRAACIIAQCKPLERGYLYLDKNKQLRIPPVYDQFLNNDAKYSSYNFMNQLPEYTYAHLADWDWAFNNSGIQHLDLLLMDIVKEIEEKEQVDEMKFHWRYKYPLYSYYTAEYLSMEYAKHGQVHLKSIIQNFFKTNKYNNKIAY
ncbi:MAG: hypothetical protein EAZ07_03935 [Cytophagales bacterium]|nr:MAG: hypothetical protein EAZ07_03935 [Cytophagales bacterium]